MTELAPVATLLTLADHEDPALAQSAGRAAAHAEIAVVGPDDTELPRGQVGEVVVRGDNVMAGYWNKPDQAAAALRGGWMHTGDAGYLDDRGYLFIVDRLKDMIITGGENVYSALIALPAVRASRVARIGASVALVGVVLLALMELVGIAASGVAADSGLATAVNNLYGPPVLLAGIGLTVAGAVLLRRGGREWPGPVWLRFVPFLTGLYVFVALTPSLTSSYVVARLGIGGWMLLFAALGWVLYRSDAAQ